MRNGNDEEWINRSFQVNEVRNILQQQFIVNTTNVKSYDIPIQTRIYDKYLLL